MKRVNLKRNTFHGDWNYVIEPKHDLIPLLITAN